MIFSFIKNKILRITAKVLAAIVCFIFLLLLVASVYVRYNKDTLLNIIKTNITKNVSGKLLIKDIDVSTILHFPNIAVDLTNVELLDSVHNKALLQCGLISCRFNIFKLWDIQHQVSKIVLQNGKISLLTDTSGYSNISMLTKKGQAKSTQNNSYAVHHVEIENVDFIVNNDLKKKDYEFHINDLSASIDQEDTAINFEVDQHIIIRKLIFNPERGSFLEDHSVEGKLDLSFNKQTKTLACSESDITINDQPYYITASFQLNQAQAFHLDVKGKSVRYEKGIGVLTPRLRQLLGNIQLKDPLTVHAVIDGWLTKGRNPLVNIEWQTKNNELKTALVVFNNASFNGAFTNNIADTLPRSDEFSRITMQTFSGNWKGLQLNGKNIVITNLINPSIEFVLAASESLKNIDDAIGSDVITFLDGSASVILSYNGPLTADPAFFKSLDAQLQISNGMIRYEPKDVLLEKCFGEIFIGSNKLSLKNFQFDFKHTHITVNALGNDMSNISNKVDAKATIEFNLNTPFLHLDEILALISPSAHNSRRKKKAALEATAKNIDQLFAASNWVVNLSADKVTKGPFYASAVKAKLNMQQNDWQIQNISFRHADGVITASGHLFQRNAKQSGVTADVQLQQINIKKLFDAFDDFGQTGITAGNLRGSLNATAHINMSIANSNAAVIPRSMTGSVNFSLKNGAIINHKGLEQVKTLFFKDRDMSNIQFAELKDRLDIFPDYIYINRMEIQSTAIGMYLEGRYDLYGKNTDMLIQVPVSNMKNRDQDYKVENKGVDAKTGLSIWIRAHNDASGDLKFALTFKKKLKDLKK